MRAEQHNLDSLRKIIRELQQENDNLRQLLAKNEIPYESREIMEEQESPDDYDEDQGARILPFNPTNKMAKVFFSYFWGRTDVYAKRERQGG